MNLELQEFTLSQRPSDANIKNSHSGLIFKTLVSGSAITHRFRCPSPIPLVTASDPCILHTPWQQST